VNSKWHFENAEVAGSFSANLGEISFTGNSLITTSIIADDALFSGTVELGFDCSFDDLIIQGGSNLNLLESITLNISNSLILESAFQNEISIFSSSIESQPTLKLAFRDILCVDYVSLSNLIVASEGIFNLGANSIASNVDGIFSEACEELVLPNFRLEQNCANSAIQFINNSIGAEDVDLYEWDFGDDFVNSQGNRTVSNPIVIFNESGEYTVTLKIQKGDLTFQFTDQVSITSNNLTPINLINVDDGLAASILQTQYVWYKDGILIPDQTSRIYQPVESGSYQVGYTSSGSVCGSRISPPFLFEVITSVNETINSERQFAYPNPTTGNIIIESVNGIKRFSVTDLTGLLLMSKDIEEAQSRIVIDLSTFGSSFYLITVFDLNGKISNHKIVKQ
jgi:PKD repeat protein